MTLSGDGGDEQFLGYGFYTWAKRLKNPFINSTKGAINFVLSKSSKNRNKRAASMFNYKADTHLPSHIFSVDQYYFSDLELEEVINPAYKELLIYPNQDL